MPYEPPLYGIFWGQIFCKYGGWPVLPFLVFFENCKENHQKSKDFCPYRTPKIPGKQGKNAQKNKEFLARENNKEFPKNKERKDRGGVVRIILIALPTLPAVVALFSMLQEGLPGLAGGRRRAGGGLQLRGEAPSNGTWGQTHLWGYSITLRTHTPQIWGVKIHPPNLTGEIFKNHLFYSVSGRSLPKFGG